MGNVEQSPPLLGLTGPAGAGKDTVAAILAEHYGYEQLAFADRVREFVGRIDPAFAALVGAYGYELAKRNHPYVRNRMVEVGEAARSIIGPEAWIDAVDRDLDDAEGAVVVSDLRKRAEQLWLAEAGGVLIAVTRPEQGPVDAELGEVMAAADLTIENDGDFHMLRERVDMIVEDVSL